ncbi:MAG: hypothetical protein R2719_02220 [Micropruina sp.]
MSTATHPAPIRSSADWTGARWSSPGWETSRIIAGSALRERGHDGRVAGLGLGQVVGGLREGRLQRDHATLGVLDGPFGLADHRQDAGHVRLLAAHVGLVAGRGQEAGQAQPTLRQLRHLERRRYHDEVVGDLLDLGPVDDRIVQDLLQLDRRVQHRLGDRIVQDLLQLESARRIDHLLAQRPAVHRGDGRTVTGRQARGLADHRRGRVGRRDGVLPVLGERPARVVHDRGVVVGAHVVAVADVLVEVVLLARLDVRPVDGHPGVPVLAALLVPQAHRMPDLVNRLRQQAAGAQGYVLPAATHAHLGVAAVAGEEPDVVRIRGLVRRGALHEADDGVLFPMCDRVVDPLLIGHARVDLVGYDAVRPAVLAAGDDHPALDGSAAPVRHRLFQLGDLAEDDVALEDRVLPHDRVLHRLLTEGCAVDDRGLDSGARLPFGCLVGLARLRAFRVRGR